MTRVARDLAAALQAPGRAVVAARERLSSDPLLASAGVSRLAVALQLPAAGLACWMVSSDLRSTSSSELAWDVVGGAPLLCERAWSAVEPAIVQADAGCGRTAARVPPLVLLVPPACSYAYLPPPHPAIAAPPCGRTSPRL